MLSSIAHDLLDAVRLSIGLEGFEDLKADLIQGMHKVVAVSISAAADKIRAELTRPSPDFQIEEGKVSKL